MTEYFYQVGGSLASDAPTGNIVGDCRDNSDGGGCPGTRRQASPLHPINPIDIGLTQI